MDLCLAGDIRTFWQKMVHIKHCFGLNWEFFEWISQIFVCIFVLCAFSIVLDILVYFAIYIDLFDSYVRFLFFVWVFFYWKREILWDFVLCFSNSLLYTFYIWKIKQWKLFMQAFDIHWFGWFLLNYLSGTREAICHYRITHVIS